MPFEANQDGTWEVFASQRNAEIYAFGAWLLALRRRAARGDGTLLNVISRLPERVVDEWPDSLIDLRNTLLAMTNPQLLALQARVANLPWFGTRNGASTEEGQTLRWAEVRVTASGQFAVPSYLGGGVAIPVWPAPVGP